MHRFLSARKASCTRSLGSSLTGATTDANARSEGWRPAINVDFVSSRWRCGGTGHLRLLSSPQTRIRPSKCDIHHSSLGDPRYGSGGHTPPIPRHGSYDQGKGTQVPRVATRGTLLGE